MEIAGLDLHGTEIAALSACQTGQGEILDGYGVFGLRRALALAGARTQVTSLWLVDDQATAELMASWYAQRAQGVPRGEAGHRVQRAALSKRPLPGTGACLRGAELLPPRDGDPTHRPRVLHPFYWAGFILAGETGPVSGWANAVADLSSAGD